MDEKELEVRCEKSKEIKFSIKFKILLGIAIFITGTIGIMGTLGVIPAMIQERAWLEMGTNWFVSMLLIIITLFIIFIALIKIAISRRPFSSVVVRCMIIIGIMHIIVSVAAPWIPGFHQTGFDLLYFSPKIWVEGTSCMFGILFIVLGKILEYGFYYQQESDETL